MTRGIKHLTLSFMVILAGLPSAWQASADEILQETVKKDVMTEADIAYATVAKVNSDTAAPSHSAAASRSEMTTVTSETKSSSAEDVWNRFSVSGVGGFMNPLNGSNQLKGQFSTGLMMGIDITDHVALEGNLIYSKYAVKGGYYGYVFGSHYYYDSRYNRPAAYGAYQSGTSFSDMRQWLYGADLVFRVFGRKVITPLLGLGLSGIRNRYYGDPIQAGGFAYNNQFTQNVLAADGLAGLELNLSKNLSLSGRFKIYSQLTNRSRYNVYPAQSSGSHNEYYQVLGGLSFRM